MLYSIKYLKEIEASFALFFELQAYRHIFVKNIRTFHYEMFQLPE